MAKNLLFFLLLSFTGVVITLVAENFVSADCNIYLIPGAFSEKSFTGHLLSKNEYFKNYKKFFEEKGCNVSVAELPSDATIELRGLTLKHQYEQKITGASHWIAHSLGGLDARYALSQFRNLNVRSLITLGTPHLGTPLAQWAAEQRNSKSFYYYFLKCFGFDLESLDFLAELSGDFLKTRSTALEVPLTIRRASAVFKVQKNTHWLIKWLSWGVGVGEGDGLVPVNSQNWGELIGTFDLDHLGEVSSENSTSAEQRRLLEQIWIYISKQNV